MRTTLRRPTPRPTSRRRPRARFDTAQGCWSLMVIDSAPIRKKAHRDYERVLREIEKSKEEVERFETEDRPKFMQWFSATFGALITETRELQEKLGRAQALVNEVQQEYYFGNHRSIIRAYQVVLRRMKEEEEASAEPPPQPDSEEAWREEEPFEDEDDSEAERAFREFASSLGFDLSGDYVQPKPQRVGRLKELYRALVRRLHPDKSVQLTRKEVEWWHQTQAAYEAGDIDQLELILTLCDIEDRGTKETSVSVLIQVTAQFKSSLRALKRQMTQYRRDPAWNFSQRQDHAEIHRKTEATFLAQRKLMRWELEKYEGIIRKWEGQANRSPRTQAEWAY